MKKEFILVIDSGLGGINILNSLKKQFHNENYLYILDNKSCPYGNKNKDFLVQNAINLIDFYMHKYKIKLIVLACNTLTSVAIDEIRNYLCKKNANKIENFKSKQKRIKDNVNYDIFVVGTEPPIKMVDSTQKTLVLATEQTIKYNKLINECLYEKQFTFVALKDVAKTVDENFYNRTKIFNLLKQQIPQKKYKNVVLGCTHYYYLENLIKMVLKNPFLTFYTASLGVTNRVGELLNKKTTPSKQLQKNGKIKLKLTKNNLKLKHIAKSLLKN